MLLQYYTRTKSNQLKTVNSLYQATPIFYINMPDGEAAPVFDWHNFPFEIFKNAPIHFKKGKTRDRCGYYDLAVCFDIETTTIEDTEKPYAFMYQWQYCIEDYVFMGKTWEEYQEFQTRLSLALDINIFMSVDELHGKSLVCYVFNLSFETMFMQHFIGDTVSPLFTDIYEPLVIPCKNGYTYRCAYRLTNKTLEEFTKGCPHAKLAGDLDYNIKRVPIAEDPKNGLTDLELAYCYNDVKGCCEALRDRFIKDKQYNIATIPLTSTGYVRKDCQRSMRKDPKCRAKFLETQLDPHLYSLCRMAFRGGNTHANARYTNKLIGDAKYNGKLGNVDINTGIIKHYDITSSYPAQILTKGFPRTPFEKVENPNRIINNLDKLSIGWCFLVTVRLFDFKYIGSCGIPYIPKAKSLTRFQDEDEIKLDNGRVYSGPVIQLSCTEIDLKIIMRDYSYSRIEIIEAYKSRKGLLPMELRRVCFDYYQRKTQLKGSTDPQDLYEYARAKELLNAIYGMMCMRIDRIEYEYNKGDYKQIIRPLQEMLNRFYDSESSFLPYQYALWVTSWSRAALDAGTQIVGNDLVYVDTDSVFYIGDHEKEFEQLNAKLEAEAVKHNAVAYNRHGEPFPIGVWTREEDSVLYKTLGAKKYIMSLDGQTIISTIAGVSKKIGADFFTQKGFNAFTDQTVIDVSGKITAYYNNDKPHYIEVNGVKILTASNIALISSSYTLKINREYKDFISFIRESLLTYTGRSDQCYTKHLN